jgi:hypothetical protein
MTLVDGVAIVSAILALFFLLASASSLRERHWASGFVTLLLGTTLFLAGLLFGAISVGTEGYRPLGGDEVAVTVTAERMAGDSILARFTFEGGLSRTYRLAGDELEIEAHVLRWRPLVSALGLEPEYELSRVSSRYRNRADDETKPRTVLSLAVQKPVDFFDLATRFAFLEPLLEHEFRLSTFTPGRTSGTYDVHVTVSDLLIRPVVE